MAVGESGLADGDDADGARPYAGRRRWPAILMGSTRMKCSGSPSTQDSRPTFPGRTEVGVIVRHSFTP